MLRWDQWHVCTEPGGACYRFTSYSLPDPHGHVSESRRKEGRFLLAAPASCLGALCTPKPAGRSI